MIIDFKSLQNDQDIKCDICIVGAGAAGSILFDKLSDSKFNIVLLESGLVDIDENYQELNKGEVLLQGKNNENKNDVIDYVYFRLRGLGGTTNHWGGGCSPFHEIDFLKRDWIKNSGWPINRDDLNPYYKKANTYFELSTDVWDEKIWDEIGLESNLLNLNEDKVKTVLRYRSGFLKKSLSKAVRLWDAVNFKKYLVNSKSKKSKNKIIYDATLTKLISENNSHINYGIVKSLHGMEKKILAKKFILCSGGYEVARILLNSGKKNGLANDNDLVGRYYLGHPNTSDFMKLICNTKETASKLVWNFGWHKIGENQSMPHLGFKKKFQEENYLLNTGIWIGGHEDKNHPIYIAKQLRRNLLNKNFKDINLSTKEFLLILKNIDEILLNIKRGYSNPRGVKNPVKEEVDIFYMAEQVPDRNSRIYLSNEKDMLGMNKIVLDWHLSEIDRENPLKIAKHLASIFGEANVGKIVLDENLKEKISNFENFGDTGHPSGTTRMSDSKENGVVDKNLETHFVKNLYICSSSVFPTSSYTSPTYTIGALAIRLSEHLVEI